MGRRGAGETQVQSAILAAASFFAEMLNRCILGRARTGLDRAAICKLGLREARPGRFRPLRALFKSLAAIKSDPADFPAGIAAYLLLMGFLRPPLTPLFPMPLREPRLRVRRLGL